MRANKPIRVFIRQKGDRKDLLLYYIDPLTGREVSKSAGTGDRGEAERAAGQWEAELAEFIGSGDGWRHFRERFEGEHLATVSARGRSAYKTALNHYQRLMAPRRLTDVDSAAISRFQSLLANESRPVSSIGNYLTHLRTALNFAKYIGMVRDVPKIRLPRQPKRTFMRSRPITEKEYKTLLKAAGKHGAAWVRFLEMLWLSGLRLGEARSLSWGAPPIKIELGAKPHPQILFYAEGHKNRQDEAVPIPPDFARWLAKTKPAARIGPVAPLPYRDQRKVLRVIQAIAGAAEIVVNDSGKLASAHDFRRAFGTRWAKVLMPPQLQKLMRHADIKTTLRYYIGLDAADVGQALWGAEPVPNFVPKTVSKSANAG